jgi:hypoxanthine phosphoribosyltransferase
MAETTVEKYQVVISESQLRQRIDALGRQISKDFQGRVVYCVGILEDGFIFVADLVRAITGDVVCQFVKPHTQGLCGSNIETTEIFYAPEVDVEGQHILLCLGMLHSGQTTDFLIRNFQARGAASVAVCALLDRQSARRVHLEVNYCGFLVGPQLLAGFGLGTPNLNRNRPFIYTAPGPPIEAPR